MFFRPKPMFRVQMIVCCGTKYLLIRKRRWVRPKGMVQKQWVYDGVLLEVTADKTLKVFTYTTCVTERDIGQAIV